MEGAQSERVSFEFDASQYDLGEYSYQIQTDTDERTGTVTIGTPATFQLASLDLDPAPLTQGRELSVTAVVRNTGDVAGEQTITARIEEETAARSRVETTAVELAGNDSHTVTLGFNTAGLDPGTYVLTVEVGEATRETEITVEPEGDSEANDSGAGDTGNETDPSADDTGVGFGVVGGLAGASAAGYLVQRRLTAEVSRRTETAGERRK